jgi:hypothetical protein
MAPSGLAQNTGTAAKGKFPCYGRYVTVRNNVSSTTQMPAVTPSAVMRPRPKRAAIAMEAAAAITTSSSTTLCTTTPPNPEPGSTGEFQIQYQVGKSSREHLRKQRCLRRRTQYLDLQLRPQFSQTYPAPPATLNWNLYNSAAGYVRRNVNLVGWREQLHEFSAWQTSSGEDANSLNADPSSSIWEPRRQTLTPPLSRRPSMPAAPASLAALAGVIPGSSPNSIYGSTDFIGNPRTNGSNIDIGAYENLEWQSPTH